MPWFAGGAAVGVPLALLYLRRYERRGWRSTGPVLLVVLVLAWVATELAEGGQVRAAAFGFTAGALAGAACWAAAALVRRARRHPQARR